MRSQSQKWSIRSRSRTSVASRSQVSRMLSRRSSRLFREGNQGSHQEGAHFSQMFRSWSIWSGSSQASFSRRSSQSCRNIRWVIGPRSGVLKARLVGKGLHSSHWQGSEVRSYTSGNESQDHFDDESASQMEFSCVVVHNTGRQTVVDVTTQGWREIPSQVVVKIVVKSPGIRLQQPQASSQVCQSDQRLIFVMDPQVPALDSQGLIPVEISAIQIQIGQDVKNQEDLRVVR